MEDPLLDTFKTKMDKALEIMLSGTVRPWKKDGLGSPVFLLVSAFSDSEFVKENHRNCYSFKSNKSKSAMEL